MTMQVLLENQQIYAARKEMINRGLSFVDSPIQRMMRKIGLKRETAVGDIMKSWDVFSLIEFIKSNVDRNEPILDIGCYASELIIALSKVGYLNITGADLNPDVKNMPSHESIRYEICDFMHTGFASESFQAITSISVIEHGFNDVALLQEMSRLLKPNGYFIASFDYWPEKIDTGGTKLFGLDWMIFSKIDIAELITKAVSFGLYPVGELDYESKDKVIDFEGWKYTFAWLALQKRS